MLDYHVHTHYCRHASGEAKEYVIEGINKGLKEIGISDHYPMCHLPQLSYDDYSMDQQEFPSYKREVDQLKKIFNSKIDVKLGAEVDYLKAKESTLRKNLTSEDVDFLMGVIHLLDNWIIDDPRNTHKYLEYDLNTFYSRYFDEIQNLIRSGLFDIVGHIDVIKKFNHIPDEGIERYIMPCLESIADKGLCLEVNTSGIDRPVKDTYPGKKFFKIMFEMGIPITLGSDAHKPSEVGRHFEAILKLLKNAGYSELISFKNREKELTKI
ncbi:MAG: histidinol-phosphatase HisJ [Candidatus Bathyarchaeota archaeon]|nr:histidinol-phosphatase HisJ [Candidatus Bathyarchaeota archaeon]MCZ2844948.1 histidinol-phosphatase HisJ [Candidatus Bathyarchaeota archaeon]